jgi:quercetin dioxygenase-like cupin family protein
VTPKVVSPGEGRVVMDGFVAFKLFSADTGGALSVVEHVLQPGTLGSPVHTHRNEDEYSYVLEGEMTALIGGELVHAPAGALVCKPRNIPHAFWNQGSSPTRILEIIAPGGFETYFDEIAEVLGAGGPPDMSRVAAVAHKYGVEMDFSSIMEISQKYGVGLGGPPAQEQRAAEPL